MARQGLQWAALRCFSSTGEASAPNDYHWLMAMAGYKPVIEICGGTEIGGGFLAGSMLQPQAPSTFSTPTMGAPSFTLKPPEPSAPVMLHATSKRLNASVLHLNEVSRFLAQQAAAA